MLACLSLSMFQQELALCISLYNSKCLALTFTKNQEAVNTKHCSFPPLNQSQGPPNPFTIFCRKSVVNETFL